MFAPVNRAVIPVMGSLVHILASDTVLAPAPALTSLERPPGHETLTLMWPGLPRPRVTDIVAVVIVAGNDRGPGLTHVTCHSVTGITTEMAETAPDH